MEYISIASGSNGNCHFINEKNTKILVDVGITGKKVVEGLSSFDIDLKNTQGILVTHEHTDHIRGVGVLSRKYDIPIFATKKTMEELSGKIGKISEKNLKIIKKDEKFNIGDLEICAHEISHDAVDPVMYKIYNGKKNIAIITDLGYVSKKIEDISKGCDVVVLESNHDPNMLEVGPYPFELKKRVGSKWGHLSNDSCGEFCAKLIKNGTKKILLAHLSRQNNMPLLAYQSVISILDKYGISSKNDVQISVLEQFSPSHCVYL